MNKTLIKNNYVNLFNESLGYLKSTNQLEHRQNRVITFQVE